jgi:chemotaxis protein methyltransferase CheR
MSQSVAAPLPSGTFETLAGFLKTRSGLTIGPDKQYLLETRLGPVMKQHGIASLPALAERLKRGGTDDVAHQVVEAMTTNESFFFRDDKPFIHLAQQLPILAAARPAGACLQVWSAACSTGQEAYSVAMLAADNAAALGGRTVQITGTDIARQPLARAQAGLYTQFEAQRGLPIRNLMKHFTKDGANWQIKPELRAMTKFREWNLLSDLRPLGQFDVVFCRNVLIYFDQATKSKVLNALADTMARDAVLYLGGAETVMGLTNRLVPAPELHGAFRKA